MNYDEHTACIVMQQSSQLPQFDKTPPFGPEAFRRRGVELWFPFKNVLVSD